MLVSLIPMAAAFALIVAAGRGTRFGGTLPKQYLPLGGGSVLRHAVTAFATHPRIAGIQVVIRDEDREMFGSALAGLAVLPPVPGGAERQDSVRLGLEALRGHNPHQVLIHDGARPFPDAALIDRVLDALEREPAAIPALPLRDTIKRVTDGHIRETDRPLAAVARTDAAGLSLPCHTGGASQRDRPGADR